MIKFYYNLAPNPTKVALFLEESSLPYEPIPVDTRKGEQHAPAYRAINPNGKVPAIIWPRRRGSSCLKKRRPHAVGCTLG